jgi:hypothetical protein
LRGQLTELGQSAFLLDLSSKEGSFPGSFAAVYPPDHEGDETLRSGQRSVYLERLDRDLRGIRKAHPCLPLVVLLSPVAYRPRNHTWMLGEYLAERDLPLWVNLTLLHPARQADWVRSLVEGGLACPRLLAQVGEALEFSDLPVLAGTGTWILRSSQIDAGGFAGKVRQA